ncbi:MAG TPA: NADH-quinone oxidoreductase subunit H [Deferrisomatales bacterium]|nr:NADH-quinone oxidoreductase subunit H [Deferrisomatales bacterium]
MTLALVNATLLVVLPPLLLGILIRTKSWVSGRTGPGVLQPYRDLVRLARKASTFSPTTTWVFRLGPALALAAPLAAGMLLPLVPGSEGGLGFPGDFVVLAYLLALGRFGTVLAALDTGSAFEGMGASREVTFAALAEPALFLCLGVLLRSTGALGLGPALGPALEAAWRSNALPLGLAAASLFLVFLAENCRVPVDDPTTHLELTMIHEVMVLDHSGPDFGLILYGASVKFLVLGNLLVSLLVPGFAPGLGPWAGLAARVGGLALLAMFVGVIESSMARLRMNRVPLYLAAAIAFPALGLTLLFA